MAGGTGEGHEWLASQPPFGAVSDPASPRPFWASFSGCLGRLAGALFDEESKLL